MLQLARPWQGVAVIETNTSLRLDPGVGLRLGRASRGLLFSGGSRDPAVPVHRSRSYGRVSVIQG